MDIDENILNAFNSTISHQANQWGNLLSDMEEQRQEQLALAAEVGESKRKAQEAQIQAAQDTAEIKGRLEKVIDNQNDQIQYQKEQIETLKEQLAVQQEQLGELHNLFASGEDGVAVQKEIMVILNEKLPDDHPFKAFMVDKVGDIAVSGVLAAIKIWLETKGIKL